MNTENPKEAAGRKKCPMHLLSPSAMRETANALGHGSEKYAPRNYRAAGINATTYVGAILRHITAWNDGEDLDPESGLSHVAHVSACCDILLDCMSTGMMNDDRSKLPSVSVESVIAKPAYRLLEKGEKIEMGDDCYSPNQGKWIETECFGETFKPAADGGLHLLHRRKLL